MKIFYLDTSSNYLYTAILEDTKVISEIKEKLERDLSSLALFKIEEMLKNNNMDLNDIEKIIVVNGPGSFTGVRIGLTIAKSISWAKKIPIIQISSLEAMALSSDSKYNYTVPAIDARRNYVFATIYDNVNKSFILKEQYISINTLEAAMGNLGDDITYISNDKLDTEYSIQEYVPDISYIVENVMNREGINPHSVDANYLKMTEAEENL